MIKDEFNTLPLEESVLPEEIKLHKNEENKIPFEYKHEDVTKEETTESKTKSRMSKMILSTIAGVSVLGTAVATNGNVDVVEPVQTEIIEEIDYSFDMLEAAYVINGNTIVLGENLQDKVWLAQTKSPISVADGAVIEFELFQSAREELVNGYGADGMSVFFSDTVITEDKEIGGGLGYLGKFGVEFDLHYNPGDEAPGGEDYPGDHISLLKETPWQAYCHTDSMELDDGKWHKVRIDYKDDHLKIFYDDNLMLESDVENYGDELYLSFSGATGGGTVYQLARNITINGEKAILNSGGSIR